MPPTLRDAKARLDEIIKKGRVDLYKPIQIAEVLNRSRLTPGLDVTNLQSYQNLSTHWRDNITTRFTGKKSTSSARYQHDVWSATAMPPDYLSVLDRENKLTGGAVERYIYGIYFARQQTISQIINYIKNTPTCEFQLIELLKLFTDNKGMRRSIDKAYEIVAYSLFETIVVALNTTISLKVPENKRALLDEFSDLAKVLLGLNRNQLDIEMPAHIYRVGVTNAADRGLDMWANFGIAIQVKHLTLDSELANNIVDQVESDAIVIVCTDADARAIETITRQIGWGRRVRGIVKESNLISWYTRCLQGSFACELADQLISQLICNFKKEFPQTESKLMNDFFRERGYNDIREVEFWSYE